MQHLGFRFASCAYGLCFSLACLLLPAAVWAQDHITQRAWLDDPSGQLTWAEVQQRQLTPFQGTLSRGFGNSAIWLKLRINPSVYSPAKSSDDRLVLRIRPVYLDDIRVYDALAEGGLAGVAGDLHHPRQDEFQSLNFLVPIARGTEPRDIWLRLASTSTRQIAVQAVNTQDIGRYALTQSLLFSSYIGLVLIFAVWGVVYWLFSREHLIGAFGLKQIAALLFALASLGHLRAMWPTEWPASVLDEATTVFSIVAVSFAVLFHVLLIREFSPPRWVQRVHWALLALQPVKLLVLASGRPSLALQINMIEVLCIPFIFLSSVLFAKGWAASPLNRPTLARPLMIGFYVLLVFILMLASLPGLGWVQGTEVGLYVVQLHGLASAFLLLLMLLYRAHVKNKHQQETALTLKSIQEQAIQEKSFRQEQEQLLTMLAHELKTPLATMQMRLDPSTRGIEQIQRSIRDMNGVIERCVQTTQLSDKRLVAHPQTCDLVKLVSDVAASVVQAQRIQLALPKALLLQTDPQLLFIVLSNLLENASKYAMPGTDIHLRLQASDPAQEGAWVLQVSNWPGPSGWPDPEQVFDKYYRSPHARRQAGTGLGLYLVQKLTQLLGGQIDYRPDAEQVHFILRLPHQPVHASPS